MFSNLFNFNIKFKEKINFLLNNSFIDNTEDISFIKDNLFPFLSNEDSNIYSSLHKFDFIYSILLFISIFFFLSSFILFFALFIFDLTFHSFVFLNFFSLFSIFLSSFFKKKIIYKKFIFILKHKYLIKNLDDKNIIQQLEFIFSKIQKNKFLSASL